MLRSYAAFADGDYRILAMHLCALISRFIG